MIWALDAIPLTDLLYLYFYFTVEYSLFDQIFTFASVLQHVRPVT